MSRIRMTKTKRILTAVIAAATTVIGVSAATGETASAANPPVVTGKSAYVYGGNRLTTRCVTWSEYRAIRRGMTQRQVAYTVGVWGTVYYESRFDGYISVGREYRHCRGGTVYVDFDNYDF